MPSRFLAPLFGLILLASAAPVPAQDAHSQSDEDACRPDVFRLCAASIPDETAIVACLTAAVPQLSPACRNVIAPKGTASVLRGKPAR